MENYALEKALEANLVFLRTLTQHLGEPKQLTDTAYQIVLSDLANNPLMAHKFAFVVNLKTMTIPFQYNVKNFLTYKGQFDLKKFFDNIHADFVLDFLQWGQAVYRFLLEKKELIEPLQQQYQIFVPLKILDGGYYWVLQEALPLQLDAQNQLISHLNIYTLIQPIDAKRPLESVGRLYHKGLAATEWTETLRKDFFPRQPFAVSEELKRILSALHQDISLNNKQIAEILNKSVHTIDRQNKQILLQARTIFSHQPPFKTVKNVVRFLSERGYFDSGNVLGNSGN